MVSKVAVVALVAIIAVPIFLGYAFNLQEVTESDYKTVGDSVNVTQLLQTGTDYTYAHGDSYQLNTNFTHASPPTKTIPIYETSYVKSALKERVVTYTTGNHPYFGGPSGIVLSSWNTLYYESNNEGSGGKIIGYYRDNNGNLITNINNLHSIYWNSATMELTFTYYGTGYSIVSQTYTVPSTDYKLGMGDSGGYVGVGYLVQDVTSDNEYVDFSAGYHFDFVYGSVYTGESYGNETIVFPDYTKNAIITIDLDSITDANYAFGIGEQCYIEKTTTDGVVSWQVKPRLRITDNTVPVTDLYYDPNSSNNTYQIKIWVETEGTPAFSDYYTYIQHYEFRYVGQWPTYIGEANYYQSFDVEAPFVARTPNFKYLMIGGFSAYSPMMRIDDAEFRAMEYQVIENNTYNPASFKTNPSTTINNPQIYGSSIEFGGNTYTVKNGNITLGSHQIPVKGLVLSSVPNEGGGYDNKIGNTVISTTAAPSTITFNG